MTDPLAEAIAHFDALIVQGPINDATRRHAKTLVDAARAMQPAEDLVLGQIAEMMDEFIDNWPEPKKVSTAIKLIAKTLRAFRDEVAKERRKSEALVAEALIMADLVERLTDAVERAVHDIGGEGALTVLKEIGPAYERLRQALAAYREDAT